MIRTLHCMPRYTSALQIYTVKLQWKRDTCKKCTLYKYLPYTVQCRSYSKKTVNQLYIYSTVLGAAIKCKQYSEITVESGTHVKSVKITLNIFAVWSKSIKEDFQNAHWIKILDYLCTRLILTDCWHLVEHICFSLFWQSFEYESFF